MKINYSSLLKKKNEKPDVTGTITDPGEVKLAAPWITYKKYIDMFFGKDPEIKILFNEEEPELKLVVSNPSKAYALSKMLSSYKEFGNVRLNISVENAKEEMTSEALLLAAFENNPILEKVRSYKTPFGDVSYALFKKEVVQFYNDEMSSIEGLKSTLYEDMAREVFENLNIYFCTNPEENKDEES